MVVGDIMVIFISFVVWFCRGGVGICKCGFSIVGYDLNLECE